MLAAQSGRSKSSRSAEFLHSTTRRGQLSVDCHLLDPGDHHPSWTLPPGTASPASDPGHRSVTSVARGTLDRIQPRGRHRVRRGHRTLDPRIHWFRGSFENACRAAASSDWVCFSADTDTPCGEALARRFEVFWTGQILIFHPGAQGAHPPSTDPTNLLVQIEDLASIAPETVMPVPEQAGDENRLVGPLEPR